MGFKSIVDYNKDKNKNFFVLPDDGDTADVIFLYTSINDVLEADAHYIKSSEYSGYVHCLEKGCPACAKGIRIQPKVFIPMYVVSINGESTNEIQMWDRTPIMEAQLKSDIFNNFPNPSEYVFRVTRHGERGDRETRYEIQVVGKNTSLTRDAILQASGFADYQSAFDLAIKELSVSEMQRMLSEPEADSTTPYQFTPTPRQSVESAVADMNVPEVAMPSVEIPEMMTPPEDIIPVPVSSDSDDSESGSGDIPEPVF